MNRFLSCALHAVSELIVLAQANHPRLTVGLVNSPEQPEQPEQLT
jgi:hypothetical protein